MKRKFTSILILLLINNLLFSQADLALSATGFQPSSIDKGDIFLVQAQVTNFGNVTAPANYMFIYYSQDLNVTDDELISRVSIRELAPNESQDINFLYPIPSPLTSGNYYIGYEIDPFDDVVESDEENLFCASDGANCITFNITNSTIGYQKFTYPILFVHGWTDDSRTWNDFTDIADLYYGWTYGGQLNYCLNPDDDQFTSDGFIQSFVNVSNLGVGDYYYVNFDVSTNGDLYVGNDGIPFNNDYSNQAAITKQGWAVSDAVEKILNQTGADRVILVGHSMGGLACREYLQNANNWQSDGNHHVAKLMTVGTPNGGSNTTGGNLGSFIGKDELSEAARDLRSPSILFEGQFLFGGDENSLSLFYNDDVDCNGFVGDNITGLNQRVSPSDVNYSCIVGVGNNLPILDGDGIVTDESADLNNFLLAQPPLAQPHSDRFDVTTYHSDIHKEIDNHQILISGIDEPRFYELAYPIPVNSLNFGYSTIQPSNNPVPPPNDEVDWDDYAIEVQESGLLEVDIWNIPVHGFALYLLDENYNVLEEVQAIGESNIGFDYQINIAGTYYIECGSIPTSNSWRFPYAYSVLFTSASGLVANFTSDIQEGCQPLTVNFNNSSDGNPSSYSWSFTGGSPSISNSQNPIVKYNQAGIYPVTLTVSNSTGNNTTTQSGYVTVKSTPSADFTFSTQQTDTVTFTNQTQFDIEVPDYLWEFGDSESSVEISPTHIYQSDGIYSVKLTATNSCGNSNSTKTLDIMTVSTNEISIESEISIFPNPAKDRFTLKIEGEYFGEYQISLINSIGQIIRQGKEIKSSNIVEYQIGITDLPSGTYFVQINSEKENHMKKIIKK